MKIESISLCEYMCILLLLSTYNGKNIFWLLSTFTASIANGWSDNWFVCSIEAMLSFDLTPYPPPSRLSCCDEFLSIEDGNEPWNMTEESSNTILCELSYQLSLAHM